MFFFYFMTNLKDDRIYDNMIHRHRFLNSISKTRTSHDKEFALLCELQKTFETATKHTGNIEKG